MKHFLLSGLAVVLISALPIPSVRSETIDTRNLSRLEPFYLVRLAYQGYFEKEGIPSNGAFLAAVESGKITSIELVKSAIEHGRLAPETLDDSGYLQNVESQLRLIDAR